MLHNVENFEEKKAAFDEGLIRINKCQEILDSDKYSIVERATISMIGWSVEEPVSRIKIEGEINVKVLPIIYKFLTGKML